MRGFEETYRNIIDYIVRITYRIWEDRDVEYIGDTYSDNSRVYDDYGLQRGNQKIIDDTHHTNRRILGHRADRRRSCLGRKRRDRPTTRPTEPSFAAPTTARASTDLRRTSVLTSLSLPTVLRWKMKIFLEHVLYNNSSMLQQLGHNLDEIVRKLSVDPPIGWPRDAGTWNALRSATSPVVPISIADPIAGFDVDRFARATFDELWNRKNFDVIGTSYRDKFLFAGPTDRAFSGARPYKELLQSLLRAFPDLELQVDEVYWMGNDDDGYLTSERWSAEGTHSGAGVYGEPSGKTVQIWGITQHHIIKGKIVAEWMLFNELDLMMQLAAE